MPRRRAFDAAAHLAVWAALYVAAAPVFTAQVAGLGPFRPAAPSLTDLWATLFAFTIGAAAYLLDRVKLRQAWLDPADAAAHPRRFAFLSTHARAVRLAIPALLILAIALSTQLTRAPILLGSSIAAASILGVLLYAARPRGRRPRPKDVLMLKNVFVAAGITGFAVITAILAAFPNDAPQSLPALIRPHIPALAFAAALLFVRVLADAVLCDLDDQDADTRHGTRTLPGRIGRGRAWRLALAAKLATAAALALVSVFPTPLPAAPLLCWAAVIAAASVYRRWLSPALLRDWVDAGFALEAAAVAALLVAISLLST